MIPLMLNHSQSVMVPSNNIVRHEAGKTQSILDLVQGQGSQSTGPLLMQSQSNVANPYQAAKKRYLAELEQQRQLNNMDDPQDVDMMVNNNTIVQS